jgi:tetratricopeptide (TPR) repeat protein
MCEAQEDEEAAEARSPGGGGARDRHARLQVRALAGSGLAKMRTGEHRPAVELLNEARSITEAESFSDVERADVLFWLGCCRYQLTSVQTALALFNEALGLAERSGLPCDALKANILSWRSRCWQRQRDFEGARDDVERALELSQGVEDLRTIGAAYFQASLIADREGHWVLARNYAERAREAYAQLADRVHVSQLTNNLGGLNFLLGNTDQAVKLLKESFAIALDLGRDADAGRAVSSLAQVHLRTGNVEQAEDQARQALDLLDGRVDYIDEIGSAQLVLGRALLEQDRLDEADRPSARPKPASASSGRQPSRCSGIARGDLPGGDCERAAELYRRPLRLSRMSASENGRGTT